MNRYIKLLIVFNFLAYRFRGDTFDVLCCNKSCYYPLLTIQLTCKPIMYMPFTKNSQENKIMTNAIAIEMSQ